MSQLVVRSLEHRFGTSDVLRDVSFRVEKGEFVSIIGPSGSGKSTLFHLIGKLYEPTSGSIELNGAPIERGMISYMPQNDSLLPWRTIVRNIQLSREVNGQPIDEANLLEWINRSGLAGYEQAYPHELSGGMRQRASFIRALVSEAPLLLLDEPFSALDELTRMNMQRWLLSIWEETRPTVLFITHNIEEALFLSDRVIVLSDKPTVVQRSIRVPFERPRREEITLDAAFIRLKKEIYNELRSVSH
ncbi:ATP-binding cassette domain-containing protein [Planococcaceae bacterium Storch 2/2-2]|nr:ATP-binding cassette domain-containing protein [Planococcaceae bacterium Storch 2/2-2]